MPELEPLLENERHGHLNGDFVQYGVRTFGSGSNVSSIDGILQLGSGRRRAVHRRVYFGARIQQFLLVRFPPAALRDSILRVGLRVPIQTAYGRRPVIIFSTLICLVSNIWRAVATSYGSYMGACVLNGFGAGPGETSQPEIIADIMFLHERGAYNTLYFTFYFGSLMVGPIVAGPMAETVGWRNFFWLNVALLGVLLLFQIFLFPETKWHRATPGEVTHGQQPRQQSSKPAVDDSEPEKPVEVTQGESTSVENGAERDPYLHKGRPSKKQFKLWQFDGNHVKTTLISFWIPWKLLTFPIVELAAFIVSWSASCFLTLNLTQSQAFAGPPYNFNSRTIGFFNFAILIGSFIGLATNGLLSDWISMRATRKNKGIREPEMRLPAMIIYVIIMIIGNFVVAFGYEYKWDWRVWFPSRHIRDCV